MVSLSTYRTWTRFGNDSCTCLPSSPSSWSSSDDDIACSLSVALQDDDRSSLLSVALSDTGRPSTLTTSPALDDDNRPSLSLPSTEAESTTWT